MILILVSGKYQVWISNRLCVAEAQRFLERVSQMNYTHYHKQAFLDCCQAKTPGFAKIREKSNKN